MQEKQLFEYAIIRVLPRVEREEFVNVGVVLYSHGSKRLLMRYVLPEEKLKALFGLIETENVERYLSAFYNIAVGGKDAGPIGLLDAVSRFRWLTASRSTMIQTSRVHPGFCSNATEELDRLFMEMVL
jgi:hypothetical protein